MEKAKKPKRRFFSQYYPKPKVEHPKSEESMTQQHFYETTNINEIVKRYEATGVLQGTVGTGGTPKWGDFSGVASFQEAQNKIIEAQNEFSKLPSEIRDFFNNQPQNFIDFVSNEENREKAIELGLIEPQETVIPLKTGVPTESTPEPEKEPE